VQGYSGKDRESEEGTDEDQVVAVGRLGGGGNIGAWGKRGVRPKVAATPGGAQSGAGSGYAARGGHLRREGRAGGRDRRHLAYELRLTNITAANLMIERVRVLDPSRGGRVVDELSGDELASRIVAFGGTPNK
jgi:hypothetical protein